MYAFIMHSELSKLNLLHTAEKSQTNATNAILHPLVQAVWGHIWKYTAEKSQTSATSVTLHPLTQAICGDIWKTQWRKIKQMQPMRLCIVGGKQFISSWEPTVEKSPINATIVIMYPLRQAIWGHIWRHTLEKSQTTATNVIMHPLGQIVWGYIWQHI